MPPLPRALSLLLGAAAVALPAALVPGVATAATPGPATARTYVASTDDVANPERGLYHYTEARLRGDGSAVPLDLATLVRWRTEEHVTLVYRVFYLDAYAGVDTLAPADLAGVAADLATVRAAGLKAVVRFAYSPDSSVDAPAARAVGHVHQLAPLLNAAADVVETVQAGFVGRWGEWYYSDSYTNDPATPWQLSDADWAARGALLGALLDSTVPQLRVQVRYPSIARRLLLPGDPRGARVGVHDDCFLAGTDDYGTFADPTDRAWLADTGLRQAVGGETCAVNAPRSTWPSAAQELATYHWSFLNADFEPDVLASWGPGLDEARRRLGYRLRLVSSVVTAGAARGGPVDVTLTLANDGWAAPLSARPVRLVLVGGPGRPTKVVPVPLDLRTVAAGSTVTVRLRLRAPWTAGSYAVSLALPDGAPGLAARPEYAVALANPGVFDPLSGRNALGQAVRVGLG